MKNTAFTILFLLFVFSCSKPDPKKIEYEVLSKFLEFDPKEEYEPAYIEQTLYDVQSPSDTMGRAFRIGKNLFLTNHHVIASVLLSGKYAQLVKQERRGFLQSRQGEFEILFHDKTRDIALLRLKSLIPKQTQEESKKSTWEKWKDKFSRFFQSRSNQEKIPENKVYFRLYDQILKEKEHVTEFIRFDGDNIKHKGYWLKFGGFDLYDREKYIDDLGEFILPPNSALFEKKGYVLPFRKKEIAVLTEKIPSNPKYEMITSIPVYQGESGSPVFLEAKKGKYYLAGITTKTLGAGDTISTPGHPLGILAYERTVSFIIHRGAISTFITNYLKKLKQELNQKKTSWGAGDTGSG